jgi:mRNA-degrading endonuclease HigB of HigAB toxin-antitoxin module
MLKIGLTGSTTFENRTKIKAFLHRIKKEALDEVTVVGLGDKFGADKYIRKFALEYGLKYQEANLPHTQPTLYSMMAESFYGKPYNVKNFFLRNNTFARYIDKCIVFDETHGQDKKIVNLIKAVNKARKKLVIIT